MSVIITNLYNGCLLNYQSNIVPCVPCINYTNFNIHLWIHLLCLAAHIHTTLEPLHFLLNQFAVDCLLLKNIFDLKWHCGGTLSEEMVIARDFSDNLFSYLLNN